MTIPATLYTVKKSVVLVGAKHVGKTSVAWQLARNTNLMFVDGDDCTLEEARINARTYHLGRQPIESIRQLYACTGKQVFREIEHNALKELSKNLKQPPFVLATGGGIVDCLGVWDTLGDTHIVLLDAHVETIWKRICQDGLPSFLEDEKKPQKKFKTMFASRQKIYKKHAHFVCDTSGKNPDEIAQEIITTIIDH